MGKKYSIGLVVCLRTERRKLLQSIPSKPYVVKSSCPGEPLTAPRLKRYNITFVWRALRSRHRVEAASSK